MKTFLLAIVLFFAAGSIAKAELTLKILDPRKAISTSYTSAEFNDPIAQWVVDGQVLTPWEAREKIKNEKAVACAGWLMNFSDDKSIGKQQIQKSLFQQNREIPLWKMINANPVFMDPDTRYALSFVCLAERPDGRIDEVDPRDLDQHWSGIFSLSK